MSLRRRILFDLAVIFCAHLCTFTFAASDWLPAGASTQHTRSSRRSASHAAFVPVWVSSLRTENQRCLPQFSIKHEISASTGRRMVSNVEDSSSSKMNKKKKKPKSKRQPQSGSKNELQTWRLYGITTHPDDDDWISLQKEQRTKTLDAGEARTAPIPSALRAALSKRLKIDLVEEQRVPSITIIRRSLDARRKLDHPSFSYVVDAFLSPEQARRARLKHQPGRTERLNNAKPQLNKLESQTDASKNIQKKKVVVVGAGPSGLFCALHLALSGLVEPILLDRGQPVERRGRDIGALIHRKQLNSESNFAFGEGGAGTWSDGKLTTRIGRNSGNVRYILEKFVEYGAPASILWEGSPHLGTDNLVRLLRNMRHDLEQRLGATILFGTKLTNIILDPDNPSVVQGIEVEQSQDPDDDNGSSQILNADAVVLATGHSARDVYETLATGSGGVCLEPKGFAVGFRIEHPQKVVTKIQYGNDWGPTVKTGKRQTDIANEEYFAGEEQREEHTGQLPVPSYRLATDKARDGTEGGPLRGVYSFCMCPGGQIVPSSTNSSEVCVNGMSFSKRDSQWANSALVVTVFPDDPILEPYREKHGVLAGLEFQRDMERRAARMGGGVNLTVPVQRVTDFIKGKVSETIPTSSYRLGVRSAACHEIYPAPITAALRDALVNHFDSQMPGYVDDDGLLHAVETRTSSPLRMARDSETFRAKGLSNLFPAGEGAGFAGGIVSAAVDGRLVAEGVLDHLYGADRPDRLANVGSEGKKSVGFQY